MQQILTDAGERTVVIDLTPGEGVDVVGNALDTYYAVFQAKRTGEAAT